MKKLHDLLRRARNRIEREFVRVMAAFDGSRRLVARRYARLDWLGRAAFHEKFSRLFWKSWVRGRDGIWPLSFGGRTIAVPLDSSSFPLDWETAVSILGHDRSVKETYELLISNPVNRPDSFIDVGANYGTHSLLFLVSGISTLTFEPNSACHAQFLRICLANRVTPSLQPFALGATHSRITLTYPESETWLGSSTPEVVASLKSRRDLVSVEVQQRRLDEFLPVMKGSRVLLKIDTEGNEAAVLEGATAVMKEIRPVVIFESWKGEGRRGIHALLQRVDYAIRQLPWDGSTFGNPMSLEQFETSQDSNFVAMPATDASRTLSSGRHMP
jgi:FkbM family methyltransferase